MVDSNYQNQAHVAILIINNPDFHLLKVVVDEVAKRNRQSPYPMLEVESALKLIFKHRPGGTMTETVNIASTCLNRVLAEDVYASEDLPPFRASIKDGYAVRAEDGPGVRTVKDAVAAGDAVCSKLIIYKLAIEMYMNH